MKKNKRPTCPECGSTNVIYSQDHYVSFEYEFDKNGIMYHKTITRISDSPLSAAYVCQACKHWEIIDEIVDWRK